MKKYVVYFGLLCASPSAAHDLEALFTEIYQTAGWGKNEQGEGHSGGGSTIQATKDYIPFVHHFMREHGIKTVVDAGCGDWEFSCTMDWSGIAYIGYDIVQFVIDKNNANYATDTISFVHGNCVDVDLPAADLLLCKDVLQHLERPNIQKFLPQLKKYRYCLITNGSNFEILDDLIAFGLHARVVHTYQITDHFRVEQKVVILVDNSAEF